jgi:hypothetical protein
LFNLFIKCYTEYPLPLMLNLLVHSRQLYRSYLGVNTVNKMWSEKCTHNLNFRYFYVPCTVHCNIIVWYKPTNCTFVKLIF